MHLQIEADQCTGCRICENFCSFHHEAAIWPARSRILVVALDDAGPFALRVCRQCDDAPCAAACPSEAILRHERTGAWVVDAAACVGCGSCVAACPYDAIVLDEERGVARKCDLCAGEPECAAMCPTGAIVVKRQRKTSNVKRQTSKRQNVIVV